MGEDAFHEIVVPASDGRMLVVRGGYGRDAVYLGIAGDDREPDEVVAVEADLLLRALRAMGHARVKGRRCRPTG